MVHMLPSMKWHNGQDCILIVENLLPFNGSAAQAQRVVAGCHWKIWGVEGWRVAVQGQGVVQEDCCV